MQQNSQKGVIKCKQTIKHDNCDEIKAKFAYQSGLTIFNY